MTVMTTVFILHGLRIDGGDQRYQAAGEFKVDNLTAALSAIIIL